MVSSYYMRYRTQCIQTKAPDGCLPESIYAYDMCALCVPEMLFALSPSAVTVYSRTTHRILSGRARERERKRAKVNKEHAKIYNPPRTKTTNTTKKKKKTKNRCEIIYLHAQAYCAFAKQDSTRSVSRNVAGAGATLMATNKIRTTTSFHYYKI